MMAGLMRMSVLMALAANGAAGLASAEPIKVGDTMEGVRNARYCEIIPIVREGFHLKATVYNTLGHNDCPPKIWEGISEDAMKERFGAFNGDRGAGRSRQHLSEARLTALTAGSAPER